MAPRVRPHWWWGVAGVVFALLATANAGGYRYGVSDQAFYIPVIVRALDPAAFPRDAALIDAQGHLMLLDELLAAVVRVTAIPLEYLFLGGYLVSLATIWAGIVLIGQRVYGSPWATIAFGLVFTMRHRIPRTSANSFEPYFHPRMLAFGIGLLAIAALLRRRNALAIGLVAVSALVHVTTAIWLAVMLGAAMVALDASLRRLAIPAAAVGVAGILLIAFGPLRGSLVQMDPLWLQAVASKDSLFASDWPLWAWLMNLGLLPLAWGALAAWRRADGPPPEVTALAWGAAALVGLFLITLPLVLLRLAFPVQLQISRVFWLVDFVATLLLVGAIAAQRRRVAAGAFALIAAVTIGRGMYIMQVEQRERPLFAVRIAASPWSETMAWLRQQPRDIQVLADPGHAWKYGTSVRVAAERDVFLEDVKDSAIAMYARPVAARVVERLAAIGDFSTLDAARARDLAARYDIDFLVTEADLALPLAHRNERFAIYRLGVE
jgi:hypothetical protein